MEKTDIIIQSLHLNDFGYFEFIFNDIKYYIRDGVFKLKGKAFSFGSEFDDRLYFVDREMPNQRLQEGFNFAMKHYIKSDFTIKIPMRIKIANEIYEAFHVVSNEPKASKKIKDR
nr:hypothetical protein [uncultured Pedobacter sp.]